MTEIRAAQTADFPAMIEMGQAFFDEAGHAAELSFCPMSFEKTLELLALHRLAVVVESDGNIVGMGAADVAPAFWNHSIKIGREAFFYIKPNWRFGLGKELIAALESASMAHGATMFDLVAERGERGKPSQTKFSRGEVLGRLYAAHGYSLAESTYRKRF